MSPGIEGELYFLSAVYTDLVEVIDIRSALCHKTDFLIVRIPAMPVGRRLFC